MKKIQFGHGLGSDWSAFSYLQCHGWGIACIGLHRKCYKMWAICHVITPLEKASLKSWTSQSDFLFWTSYISYPESVNLSHLLCKTQPHQYSNEESHFDFLKYKQAIQWICLSSNSQYFLNCWEMFLSWSTHGFCGFWRGKFKHINRFSTKNNS